MMVNAAAPTRRHGRTMRSHLTSPTNSTPYVKRILALGVCGILACGRSETEQPAPASSASPSAAPTVTAARVPAGALRQVPWLLGSFRGRGEGATVQEPFYERYSLADDSTLIVESFKDSTLTGAIDTSRYEVRRDSLASVGERRYVATVVTADSLVFGPLVGVRNAFTWRRGDDNTSWVAVITPSSGGAAAQRHYRMVRMK